VRFAQRWEFVNSAVFETIWQIVPRADHSEGERLLGEPRRAGGRRLQQILTIQTPLFLIYKILWFEKIQTQDL